MFCNLVCVGDAGTCLCVRLTVYWVQPVSQVCLGVWVAGMTVDSTRCCSSGEEASLGGKLGGTALECHSTSSLHLHVITVIITDIIIIIIKGYKMSYKDVYGKLKEGLSKQREKIQTSVYFREARIL